MVDSRRMMSAHWGHPYIGLTVLSILVTVYKTSITHSTMVLVDYESILMLF